MVLIKLRRYIKYLRMYLLTIIIANRKENSMASIHDVEDVFGKKPNSIPEIIVFTFFSLSVLLSLVFIFPLICFFVLRNPNARLFSSTWTFSFVFVEQYTHTTHKRPFAINQSRRSFLFCIVPHPLAPGETRKHFTISRLSTSTFWRGVYLRLFL